MLHNLIEATPTDVNGSRINSVFQSAKRFNTQHLPNVNEIVGAGITTANMDLKITPFDAVSYTTRTLPGARVTFHHFLISNEQELSQCYDTLINLDFE